MATTVQELRVKAQEAIAAYNAEYAKYDETGQDEDRLPDSGQMKTLGALKAAADEAAATLAEAEGQVASFKAMGPIAPLKPSNSGDKARDNLRTAAMVQELKTLGSRFVENPAFRDWMNAVMPNGGGTRRQLPDSPTIPFGGLQELDQFATLLTGASSTSAGAFITEQRMPGFEEFGRRPLRIRNVVTNLQTSSDAVEYVTQTAETNNAAPVAEATATSDGTGQKPESAMAFSVSTANVKTIAHWLPATRQALADAPQLRGIIDSFLRYGLEEEVEDQIANGDGTGQNFTGMVNWSGIQAQAWDTDIFTTIRKGKTIIRTNGRRTANAVLLSPTDWETIELQVDNSYRFYGQGPFGNTVRTIWGLPVVETEAMTTGTGMIGDFSTCVLWDREAANISVSDSHSDFFTRNMIAILAELRLAFAVLRPAAIATLDLTA